MATPTQNRIAHLTAAASPAPSPSQRSFSVMSWSVTPEPAARSKTRVVWTPEMERALVESLVYQVTEMGKRADSGYKKEAWEYTRNAVQQLAGTTIVTVQHCKGKHDSFKKDWKIYTALIGQSGFGVDGNGVVTGDEKALKEYFKKHPDASKFQYKPLRFVDELRRLFEGVLATGEDVLAIEDLLGADEPAQSVERDLSLVVSTSEESSTPGPPRKRSGTESVHLARPGKKNSSPASLLVPQIAAMASQIANLVVTMNTDYQRDAIESFMIMFAVLYPALKLTIVEDFGQAFAAKAYCLLTPEMRKKWVEKQLLAYREGLAGVDFDGYSFDGVMDSIEWSGDGVLGKKVSVEVLEEVPEHVDIDTRAGVE